MEGDGGLLGERGEERGAMDDSAPERENAPTTRLPSFLFAIFSESC